jgi:formyl-CoA transferase
LKKADIVLENSGPETMEKLGLGYRGSEEGQSERFVYGLHTPGSVTPDGTARNRDPTIIAQAMGGLRAPPDGPAAKRTRTGTAMGDILAGLSAGVGVLAALTRARFPVEGQKVDIALVDSVVASLENHQHDHLVQGRIPQRIGNRYESTIPTTPSGRPTGSS